MWGMAYCQLSFRELLLCAFLAYILMGMIHIISSRMSPLAVIVIVCALPLLSGATLRRSDAQRQAGESIAPTSQESYGTWRLIVPLLALFFFAFCGELLRSFSLASNAADVGSMGTLYHLGGAVGSAVLLLAIFLPPLSRRLRAFESALVIIRWVFIVMAAAFVFVSFFNIPFEVSYALFSAGFHCLRAVAWVFVIQLVQRFGFSPVRSVGLSQCVIAAAPVVSLLLFPILFSVNLTALPWDSISLIFLFIMFVLVSFLLGSKAIQTVSTPLTQEAQTIDAPASPDSHAPHTQGSGLPVAEGSDGVSMAEKLRERGLSAREVDVACLLARGRSLPFIKDELSISLATAQTHQRHIYQKLKVHSRQEFLDTTEAL
jgi:DNA-binding CsgD family transcriptional regulator